MTVFWERLEMVCDKKNVRPNTVTKAIGLSTAAATGWKRDGTYPKGDVLARIADYLDCSVDYLLGRTDNPETKKIPQQQPEDEGIEMYLALDDGDKGEIRGEMKYMLRADKYHKDELKRA